MNTLHITPCSKMCLFWQDTEVKFSSNFQSNQQICGQSVSAELLWMHLINTSQSVLLLLVWECLLFRCSKALLFVLQNRRNDAPA